MTTKANGEAAANAALVALDVQTFFPRARVRQVRKTKSGPVIRWPIRPQSPGYLFARVSTRELFYATKHAKCRPVCFDGQPTRVPNLVMEVLRAGADATGFVRSRADAQRKRFETLQKVAFEFPAAMHDQIATVIQDDGGHTVQVLLRLLGKDHRMSVPADDLRAA